MPGATTFYGLPYPLPTESVDVPRDVKALADKLELWKNGFTVPTGNVTIGSATDAGQRWFESNFLFSGHVVGVRLVPNSDQIPVHLAGWVDGVRTCYLNIAADGAASIHDGAITRPIPFAMQVGTAVVAVSASISGSVAVNFTSSRFTQTPMVVTTSVSSNSYVATASGISTSGFTASVRQIDATSSTASITVHWVAVQMLPGSGPG